MSTLKRLRVLTIFQALYCGFCALSCVLFLIYDRTEYDWLLFFGILSMYGWCINPIGPVTLILGLRTYLRERKNEVYRNLIGFKWVCFLVWPVIDTVLYIVSGVTMVGVTGGV